MDAPDEARRAHIAKSNRQWRAIFALLAIVVPGVLGGLFERQSRRLLALVDHGQMAPATVARETPDGKEYRYEVDGKSYSWTVRPADLASPVGAVVPITYLPEAPQLSRVGAPYSRADYDAERQPGIVSGFPIGICAFFLGASLLCHRGVRKHERGEDRAPAPARNPNTMGMAIAGIILLALLAGTLAGDSQAIFRTLWGPRPLGVPLFAFTAVVATILYLPWFLATPALCRLVLARPAHEQDFDEAGILRALWHASEAQRPDRRKVVFTCVYSVLLIVLWIAYAAFRGI